ncbi:MAG: preprotein translocase subunit YajC [Alphaproteobacteria bacterium]
MFISEAFAQTVQTASAAENAAAGAPDGFKMILQFALILAVLYFILIRPQQKRLKKHEAALQAITKGSHVVVGGIEGVVTKVIDNTKLQVKIADNTEITVLREYISAVTDIQGA